MSTLFKVRIPKFPECWESCGSCGAGEVSIDDILVLPGDRVARDDTLFVLETAKVALDIPSPVDGCVHELFVGPGDKITEGQQVMTIQTD